MQRFKNTTSGTSLPDINALLGPDDRRQTLLLQKFLATDYAKILLTLIMLLILFAVAFFLSYISSQKRQRANLVSDIVPEAEIKLPSLPIKENEPDQYPSVGEGCVVGGCNSELCVAEGEEVVSICIYREEFECYKSAVCERQQNGKCGWTQTEELNVCLAQY